MAEKVLKTKIQLRYDEFTNWTTNNPFLKKGEIAVTVIPAAATNTGDVIPPAIMFKVGSGEEGDASKFNSLPWASALAADVHPWAKAKTAPVIPTVGNGKITIRQNNAEKGSFTVNQSGPTIIDLTDTLDTNTQYNLVLSGHTLTLQSKEKGETEWTKVKDITLPDNDTTYTFEEGAENGKFKVIPSVGDPISVPVHGLKSAAWKDENAFDAHGEADKVLGKTTDAASANTVYGAKAAAAAAQATANSKYTLPAGKIPKTDLSSDVQTSLGKADSALQSHQPVELSQGSTNGTLKLTVNGTVGAEVKVKNINNAAYKDVDTTVKSDSTNLITSGAVKTYVDDKVVSAVQYLGTVSNATELAALNPDSAGDFCRVSTAFGSYHASDILVCKTIKSGSTAATWDVIHGEANTWVKNTATADGYVVKTGGTSNAGKVWKVGTDGAPAWLADDNTNTSHNHTGKLGLICTGTGGTSGTVEYKAALKSETPNANTALAVPTANANRFYPVEVDKDGKLAVTVPWTDTKITDTNQKIKAGGETFGDNAVIDIVGGTNITVTPGTDKITINGKSDDAINGLITAKINDLDVSNITGMGAGKTIKTLTEANGKIDATFQDISITASQISNLAATHPGVDKTGTVTKVSATVGSGLKITGDATKTPNIDWDDTVVLVFDCGDSNGPLTE